MTAPPLPASGGRRRLSHARCAAVSRPAARAATPRAVAHLLFVSKPIAPPWNDGSKNVVRDVARHLTGHRVRLLGRRGRPGAPDVAPAELLPVHPAGRGRFAPGGAERLRTLLAAARTPDVDLLHYFFAPSPATRRAADLLRRLRPVPSVHTVCSAPLPRFDPAAMLLADRTVVLSEHTERRYLDAGVPAERIRRIPVPLAPVEPPSPERRAETRRSLRIPHDAPLVLYAGDLEFGGGAERILRAFALLPKALVRDAVLVMACRAKTERARHEAERLGGVLGTGPLAKRVRWAGEVPDIHALLATADVVALPSDSLVAKVDHPLVLLEAMSLGRPVLVCDGTPAAELSAGGALSVPATPEAVADGLSRLLEDPGDAEARGLRGADYVRATHDPAGVAAQYAALYDEALEC